MLSVLIMGAFILQQNCKKTTNSPNIVVIVLDTLRADHLPFYGYPKDTAPFLGRLVSQGVLFENAFAASSWTAPSTASIFTSLYPFQHGVTTGYFASRFFRVRLNRIPAKIKTLPEVLKGEGYSTFGVADNINISERIGFTQGFDRFQLFADQDESKMNPQLKQWAPEIKKQKKYFLYIHYNDCHTPLHKRFPWYQKQQDNLADLIAQYDSEINYVDAKLKEMYELFGWDKNTLLIVTADHGEELKERGKWGHGNTLYSEVVRVPFLICFPGKEKLQKRIATNVSNIDILPTLRGFLGIEANSSDAGVDLMPLIRGKVNKLDERFLFSHLLKHAKKREGGDDAFYRATIFRQWKSIYYNKSRDGYKKELYNLAADRDEKVNIFSKKSSLASRLFIRFITFEKKCIKFEQEIEDVKINKKKMEELKSLGYVK